MDGEERRRDSFEVLPLAAAEQVLVPWMTYEKSRDRSQLLLPSSAHPGTVAGGQESLLGASRDAER